MEREELLKKGFTEEQVSELLNLFHAKNAEMKATNAKLQNDLNVANATITDLSKIKETFDAEHKAKLTEEEKLQEMKQEIEKNLADSKIIVNTAKAKTILADLGTIDEGIIKSLVSDDEAKTEANAQALLKLIQTRDTETAKKTKESLLNTNVLPPNNSNVQNSGLDNGMTKEKYNNMSMAEKTKLFKENKELWEKMTKEN